MFGIKFFKYYHGDDENYRNRFDELFGHLFILKSVKPEDIGTEFSTEYIKRLIQELNLLLYQH